MKTVAVLDDDAALVELYQTILEEEGYAVKPVIFSKKLAQVLDNITATQPDGLILDVHLPGLGSFEIMQGMAANPCLVGVQVLVCSASRPSLQILTQLMTEAGLPMPPILEKPFDLDELVGSIGALIGPADA